MDEKTKKSKMRTVMLKTETKGRGHNFDYGDLLFDYGDY